MCNNIIFILQKFVILLTCYIRLKCVETVRLIIVVAILKAVKFFVRLVSLKISPAARINIKRVDYTG